MNCVRDTSISAQLPLHKKLTQSLAVYCKTYTSLAYSYQIVKRLHTGLKCASRSSTKRSHRTTSPYLPKTDSLVKEWRSIFCASVSVTRALYRMQCSGGKRRVSVMELHHWRSRGSNIYKTSSKIRYNWPELKHHQFQLYICFYIQTCNKLRAAHKLLHDETYNYTSIIYIIYM